MHTIIPAYDWPLILLSVLVAFYSSYIALNISSRLSVLPENARKLWIYTGSIIQGLGFWAMHFIGMLALDLTIEVTYYVPLVLLSIIPAILSCSGMFYLISRPNITKTSMGLSALLISIGIIAMHYIGMASMKMDAEVQYEPFLLVVSFLVAFAASLASLFLLIFVREFQGFHWKKVLSASVMAIAVSGMHYIAMAAAIFRHDFHLHIEPEARLYDISLVYNIATIILVVILIAFISIRSASIMKTMTDTSNKKFESIFESIQDGIIVSDQYGKIIQWNNGAARMFGYQSAEVIGKNIQIIIPLALQESHIKEKKHYLSTKVPHVIGEMTELQGLRKDGSAFPLEMSLGSWTTNEGVFFSGILRDITERKQNETKINKLVYEDPLTGLANRRMFADCLTTAINQSSQTQYLALLYLDLDQFKLINDTFGHPSGDKLLAEVAKILQSCVKETDTVARIGGDEFILLLPNTDTEEVSLTANKVLEALNKPIQLGQEEILVTPSIGISSYPADGEDSETLIKHADIAMYWAKEEGKNDFRFFRNEMNETVSKKAKMAMAIRQGLEKNEFSVYYQPKISLDTRQVISVEALLRWNHPEWGNVSPAEFIPVAEDTGSIQQLGEFVLLHSCVQNKRWQELGMPPIRVAVNVSAGQFSRGNFVQTVRHVLEVSGLDAEYLEIEVTESILQNVQIATSVMNDLKTMGIYLSLDDFGTGYSSLSYLKMFPFDALKIDIKFIQNIGINKTDTILVETMIKMARDFSLETVAEGVETANQLSFLEKKGCHAVQGYYFHRPLPPEGIFCLLEETLQTLHSAFK